MFWDLKNIFIFLKIHNFFDSTEGIFEYGIPISKIVNYGVISNTMYRKSLKLECG